MCTGRMCVLGVLVLLSVAFLGQGYPDCPPCSKGQYVKDNGERCGKCTTCARNTYNTHPGRATHCARCRTRCFDEIQIIGKSCTPLNDIYCKCPAGQKALTQEDMCYPVDDKKSTSASPSPPINNNAPGRGNTTPSKPKSPPITNTGPPTTEGGIESSDPSLSTRNTLIGVFVTALFIVLVVIVICIWRRKKGKSMRVPRRIKRIFRQCSEERNDQSSVYFERPLSRPDHRPQANSRSTYQPLRDVFIHLSNRLPVKDWKMFLRMLPGPRLEDQEIDDIEQGRVGTPERLYQALLLWAQRNPNATLHQLLETLRKCKQNAVAQELYEKFGQNLQGQDGGHSGDNGPAAVGRNNEETGEMHPLLDPPSVDCGPPTSATIGPPAPTPARDSENYPVPESGAGESTNDELTIPGSLTMNEPNPFDDITKKPTPAVQEGATKNPDLIGELPTLNQYGVDCANAQSQSGGLNDTAINTVPKVYINDRNRDDPSKLGDPNENKRK